jgi:hypothetical protein
MEKLNPNYLAAKKSLRQLENQAEKLVADGKKLTATHFQNTMLEIQTNLLFAIYEEVAGVEKETGTDSPSTGSGPTE